MRIPKVAALAVLVAIFTVGCMPFGEPIARTLEGTWGPGEVVVSAGETVKIVQIDRLGDSDAVEAKGAAVDNPNVDAYVAADLGINDFHKIDDETTWTNNEGRTIPIVLVVENNSGSQQTIKSGTYKVVFY